MKSTVNSQYKLQKMYKLYNTRSRSGRKSNNSFLYQTLLLIKIRMSNFRLKGRVFNKKSRSSISKLMKLISTVNEFKSRKSTIYTLYKFINISDIAQ